MAFERDWTDTDFKFSSLSESGFIPTSEPDGWQPITTHNSSHLFQRVASFLLLIK